MSPVLFRSTQEFTVWRKEPIITATAMSIPKAQANAAMETALRLKEPERYRQPRYPGGPSQRRRRGWAASPRFLAVKGVNRAKARRMRKAAAKLGREGPDPKRRKTKIPARARARRPRRKKAPDRFWRRSSNSSRYQTARTRVRAASRAGIQAAMRVAATARP